MNKIAKNILIHGAIIGVSWLSYIIANDNAYYNGLVSYLAAGLTFFACEFFYMGVTCFSKAKEKRVWIVLGIISIIFAIIIGYFAISKMFGH